MKERNELDESKIREALRGYKPKSDRWDEIWENIRKNRSAYSTRGSRRHMEKIIVGYVCAALAFTLTITVGVGLWSKMTEEDPPNPAGARPTDDSAGMQFPTSATPTIIGTKSIWGDKEGVEDFVKLLNTEKGWENEPMNKLEDDRDELNYQFNTSYSAENILRIHSSDLEGQDDYQIYQQYGDELKSWVLYRSETIYPLMEWEGRSSPSIGSNCSLYTTRVPISIYDITLANPLEDGSFVLLIVANSRKFDYHVDWHDDDTKDYYLERYDADSVHVYEFNIDKGLNTICHTGEEDESFYVFRNRTDSERTVDILYAHPNSEVALTITGEFSYESSIGKRYGYLEYSERPVYADWEFKLDTDPETTPPVTTKPSVSKPMQTQPDGTAAPAPTVPEIEEKEPGVLSSSDFTLKVDQIDHKAKVSILEQGDETALRVEVLNEDGSVMCSYTWNGPGFITINPETAENPYASCYFGVLFMTHYDYDSDQSIHVYYAVYTVQDGQLVISDADKTTGMPYYSPPEPRYMNGYSVGLLFNAANIARYKMPAINAFRNGCTELGDDSRIIADSLFPAQPYTCTLENSKYTPWDLNLDAYYDFLVAYYQKAFPKE